MTTAIFAAFMSVSTLPDLFAMSLLGGFAFGGHWAVIPAVISDLFGLKHYAQTYTSFQLAPAAGGYLLGTLLIGTLYQNAAARNHDDVGYCIGIECYSFTWGILTGLNIAATIGTWFLFRSSIKAYASL